MREGADNKQRRAVYHLVVSATEKHRAGQRGGEAVHLFMVITDKGHLI